MLELTPVLGIHKSDFFTAVSRCSHCGSFATVCDVAPDAGFA